MRTSALLFSVTLTAVAPVLTQQTLQPSLAAGTLTGAR